MVNRPKRKQVAKKPVVEEPVEEVIEEEVEEEEEEPTEENEGEEETAETAEEEDDKKEKKDDEKKHVTIETHPDGDLGRPMIHEIRQLWRSANSSQRGGGRFKKGDDKKGGGRGRHGGHRGPSKEWGQAACDVVVCWKNSNNDQYSYKFCMSSVLMAHSKIFKQTIIERRIAIKNNADIVKVGDESTTRSFQDHQMIIKVDNELHPGIIKVLEWMHTGNIHMTKDNFESIALVVVKLFVKKLKDKLPELAKQFGFKWEHLPMGERLQQRMKKRAEDAEKKEGEEEDATEEVETKSGDEEEVEEEAMEDAENGEDEIDDSEFPPVGGKAIIEKCKIIKKMEVLDFIVVPKKQGRQNHRGKRGNLKRKNDDSAKDAKKPRKDESASPRKRTDNRQNNNRNNSNTNRTPVKRESRDNNRGSTYRAPARQGPPAYQPQPQMVYQQAPPSQVYYGQQQPPQQYAQQYPPPQGYPQPMQGQYGYR